VRKISYVIRVVEQTKEKLQKAGFGFLTNMDIKEKFKHKLGIDFKKYVILGAYDPVIRVALVV
jgi:uncharacterized protein (DUF302 family)